ncbi:MAG: hypothetical protein HYV24_06145 [Deltaproteobacteria bacterium]|nr:hypothetical protein [Deltaproteobacteria bacterium]
MPLTFGFKDGIIAGAVGGVLWGFVSMAVNSATGVFTPETGLLHDTVSFALGGGLFGVVAGGIIGAGGGMIPFRNIFARSIFTSTLIWLILRVGGAMLSTIEPERYHVLTPEALQGLSLSALLGAMIAGVWSFWKGTAGENGKALKA